MNSNNNGPELVATVFSRHDKDNQPRATFQAFLRTQKTKIHSIKVLKSPTRSDPLIVTEYLFTFPSESTPDDLTSLRRAAYEWGIEVNTNIAIQRNNIIRRYKRLVVFDMDSTLIKQEVIDEIASYLDEINPEKKVGARVAVSSVLSVQVTK